MIKPDLAKGFDKALLSTDGFVEIFAEVFMEFFMIIVALRHAEHADRPMHKQYLQPNYRLM